ncbi:MAG: putative type-1 restriction enzyme specificity protein MG438 [Syntrophorhabdus sp. PtaU1.Bin002]|nr:MAG: putative type-1 restriction enzyme specificity protein MG438 [Syntrophorhabdus sp. PtaB.Bin006]OPY71941.1 MAG: putative type-1 restriction enzyme specificity protein MG438 [Syntrophorhabdus sp. PtaU1.Bin002]
MQWPTSQLRHVFDVTSGATPESGKPEYWNGDIFWVTPEDVGRIKTGYWLRETKRTVTMEGYNSCGTTIAPRGSIILTKRAPIGQLAVLDTDACSNQGCLLLTTKSRTDSRFFYYFLSAESSSLQALGRGSTFMELSVDDLKALHIPVPNLEEQQTIADYLDRETTKIDAMIDAKERLLGLLAEKRRALITCVLPAVSIPTFLCGTLGFLGWDKFRDTGKQSVVDGCSVNETSAPKVVKKSCLPSLTSQG